MIPARIPLLLLRVTLLACLGTFGVALRAAESDLQWAARWRLQTDGPIRGGSLVVGDRVYCGSGDGSLYAVEWTSGRLVWKRDIGGPIASQPAMSGRLVVATSREGRAVAVEAETGEVAWTYKTGATIDVSFPGWDYFDAGSLAHGEFILIGSGDGSLYALDAASGALRWRFETKGRIRAKPTVADGRVYLASCDGSVYVLDLASGELYWKFDTEGAALVSKNFGFDRKSIYTQPVIADGLLVFGSRDGHVYAVDIETREQRWSFTYGSTWAMALSVADGVVFVGWSTNDLACALDLGSGKEIWSFNAGGHVYAKPLAIGDTVVFGSANGFVYQLSRDAGEVARRYEMGCEVYGSPQATDGLLLVGGDDGALRALELGPKPIAVVYEPDPLPEKLAFNLVDARITPYLLEHDFQRLSSGAALDAFLRARIEDGIPSVVVFAFADIPVEIAGDEAGVGSLRKFLDTGGRVIWFGSIPNLHSFDAAGNYRRSSELATRILDTRFDRDDESGCYANRSTQEGRNQGLPAWFTGMNQGARLEDVTPLSMDEFGRVGAWMKRFGDRPGGGFVSCRPWSYNVDASDEALDLIRELALCGLR